MTDDRTHVIQVLDGDCPKCGGSLDTGYECNNCDFDGLLIVHLREACELRGERMHPSGLYESEMGTWPPTTSEKLTPNNRLNAPTCASGWKQVTDNCPVCGPDGPCIDTEATPLRPSIKRRLSDYVEKWNTRAAIPQKRAKG